MKKPQENDTVQISDDDLLYRRVHAENFRLDGRIYFAAYTRPKSIIPDPEISVDLARLTTPEKTLEAGRLPVFGLGVLRVGEVRELGFTVCYQKTRNNIAHCIIEGAKTETDCARLADITRVHTFPPRKSST